MKKWLTLSVFILTSGMGAVVLAESPRSKVNICWNLAGEGMYPKRIARIGVMVTLKAIPGRELELEKLLQGADKVVQETEPLTLYWYSARLSRDTFLISDGFEDEAGVAAHFNGKIAAALKERAADLVVGGWEQGVLPNIVKANILSSVERER